MVPTVRGITGVSADGLNSCCAVVPTAWGTGDTLELVEHDQEMVPTMPGIHVGSGPVPMASTVGCIVTSIHEKYSIRRWDDFPSCGSCS